MNPDRSTLSFPRWPMVALPLAIAGAASLLSAPGSLVAALLATAALLTWGACRLVQLSRKLHEAQTRLLSEIAAHRYTEETLAEQQHRLRTIIESEPECVKIHAADGSILEMNPAGLAIVEADRPEDIVGKSVFGYIAPEHRPAYAEMSARVFEGESAKLEFRLISLKGRQRWMETNAAPLRNPRGDIVALLGITRDVTDRRHAEENERQHRVALGRLLRMQSMAEMATTIAHELNQPLTAIVNYSRGTIRRLNAGQASGSDMVESMQTIAGEADRAARIIRNIRGFVSKQPPRTETTDVNLIVHSVVRLLTPELRKQLVELRLALGESLPPVTVVPIEIEQVILNLARNAIESMGGAPRTALALSIGTRMRDDGAIEVEVSDTGPGVASPDCEQIFEPFFTTKDDGLGMGLGISRSIVEAYGGKLWLARSTPAGASFMFSLPSEHAA